MIRASFFLITLTFVLMLLLLESCHQERLQRNQFGSCDCCCCVGSTVNDCQISYIHLLSNLLRSLYYLLLYYWAIGIFTLLGNRNDPSKSNHFKFSRLLTRKKIKNSRFKKNMDAFYTQFCTDLPIQTYITSISVPFYICLLFQTVLLSVGMGDFVLHSKSFFNTGVSSHSILQEIYAQIIERSLKSSFQILLHFSI